MRPPKACISCNRRKQKCDLESPCGRCLKLKTSCTYADINSVSYQDSMNSKNATVNRLKDKENKIVKTLQSLGLNSEAFISTQENSTSQHLERYSEEDKTAKIHQEISNLVIQQNNFLFQNLECQLFEIYFALHNKTTFLISEASAKEILHSKQLEDALLLNSICARSLLVFNYINSKKRVHLKENLYYQKAKTLLIQVESSPTLKLVQSLLLLTLVETFENEYFSLSVNLAKAIRYSQLLGHHRLTIDDFDKTPDFNEKFATWSYCSELDRFISMFFNNPTIIHHKPFQLTPFKYTHGVGNPVPLSTLDTLSFRLEFYKVNDYTVELFCEYRRLVANKGVMMPCVFLSKIQEISNCIKKLEEIHWIVENSQDLFIENINIVTHPNYVSIISYNQFRLSFLCQLLYDQQTLTEQDSEDVVIDSIDYMIKAQKSALELFRITTESQKQYSRFFTPKCGLVFFLIEIGHIFSFELPYIPFSNSSTKASQKIMKLWKEQLGLISLTCPVFKKTYAPPFSDVA